MIKVNEDKSIYLTRGDTVAFSVSMQFNGESYIFKSKDVLRFKAFEKNNCENVVLQKDFAVEEGTDTVELVFYSDETKIGEVISKPKDYWYEVELNPLTKPQTIIGYDEEGPKILRLYPEGADD